MLRRSLFAAGLLTALAAPLQAQVPLLDIRLGAHAAMPTGDFADEFDGGFGAYGRVGVPLGVVKLFGSLTWNRFKAVNPLVDDQDLITVQAGPHFSPIPLLDIGVEGAYFSESEEFGLAPNISLGFVKLEVTASYNTTLDSPRSNWVTLGVGFRF
jgi:hypothetical protein